MRDHTKLRAFGLADFLAKEVYKVTSAFPDNERYGLSSQMRRSAVSTACNIVEGSARRTETDYLRFLDIAYGSARELQYLISLAFALGYLDEKKRDVVGGACSETSRVLNALIRSLRTDR
jgi:four helix bundle protein